MNRGISKINVMNYALVLGLGLVLASGCDQRCVSLAEQEASLRIGYGIDQFNPIGEITGFERGMQGGFHIFAALQATGMHGGPSLLINKNTPIVTYDMNSDDGQVAGGIHDAPIRMNTLPDGTTEFYGEFAIFTNYDPSELQDVNIEIFAEIEDTCGRSVSSSVRTTLTEGRF